MKYPKISNYPSFDMLSGYQGQMAELDSIRVREMMQNQELNIDKIQFTPPHLESTTLFTGIQVKQREPMQERDLSTEEFLNLFERKESLKMAYIPHFITQCVVYYLDLLVAYARDNRLSEYKKQTRRLKEIRKEYMDSLEKEMPPKVFQKFLAQRDEYLESCGGNLTLMFFTFGNQILKYHGRVKHESVFCYANIIIAFIDYVEDFDRQVNKRIAEKLGMPCRNHGDARLTAIKSVCMGIKNQYPIEPNDQTKLCVSVMANKASAMINAML
ncbi:hypothetical protein EEL33_08875 [Muribaculaceae bacterium Isolate-037 (Harlan)]|jgi:hypothetical protein|nr:hypothetical protein EEL39_14740 [Muribaculaceae bacterium Isolate-080 (Janvier)]ROT06871.1 hypothetical protein EEL33_08875 [Muribaculaceae bacterium Isolate-037 (Harlan)]